MENQENLCTQPSRKQWTPQQARKPITNGSLFVNESLKKGDLTALKNGATKESFKVELLPKTEELNGKKKKENFSEGAALRRPSTVSGGFWRKTESSEKERSPCIPMSKSFSVQSKSNSFDHRSIGSASSTPPSTCSKVKKQSLSKSKVKSPVKNYKIDYTEDFESSSLFPRAVYEQGQVIEMLWEAREELREKMVEKIKSKGAAETDNADRPECFSLEPPNFTNFENAYSGTLEEIFQAWVNLFYFIINLKINLICVLNSAGTESFRPNTKVEKEIVGQAIECVKFFSRLKIKSLVNLLEELRLSDDHNLNETQIKEYEEKVSSPFLFEMDFVQKKAKEIVEQAKSDKNSWS